MAPRAHSYLAIAAAVVLVPITQASPLSTNPHGIQQERPIFSVAPLVESHHPHGTLNNSYMVLFKDDVSEQLVGNHLNFLQMAHSENPLLGDEVASGLRHIYSTHIKGYSGQFSPETVNQIRLMPEVALVEKDQMVRISDDVPLETADTQKGAPWGLARLSHRNKLGFSTFTKYEYVKTGGEGVDVYVIDTGINVDHEEFHGRASWGKTIPQNDVDEDGNGHGTHCAGTIASSKYGVAKGAHVIAVKVLGSNGSGSMSDVVAGVDFAAQAAREKLEAAQKEFAATGKTSHKGSVANMSLGGGKSQILDLAVNNAVDNGMHFAVAAGNDNRDACNYSPAAAANAVTVGASTLGDVRAYFSNYGKCVDVFAPGLNILSTYIGSKKATTTMSGTSMASPHTAGLLAYLLSLYGTETFTPTVSPDFVPASLSSHSPAAPSFSRMYSVAHSVLPSWVASFLPPPRLVDAVAPTPKQPKTLTPKQLKDALLELATKDALTDVLPAGTPNLLIFNNATQV